MLNARSTRQQRWDGKTNGLHRNRVRAGPVYGKFSMHETHRVTHLVMIMFTEEVKDTVTLLLFYLLNIWECSVLPVGNVFFRRRFRDDPAVVQGRRRITASLGNAASCRRERRRRRRQQGRCRAAGTL